MFFFSSRGRHTRYWRDWSSDVCSSDLALALEHFRIEAAARRVLEHAVFDAVGRVACGEHGVVDQRIQIGRASCRERVETSVIAVSWTTRRRGFMDSWVRWCVLDVLQIA